MRKITQLLKRILAFILDVSIVVLVFNVIILLTIPFFSKKYGDFMNFLHIAENNPSYFIYIYIPLLAVTLFLYLVLTTIFLKNTLGLELFAFRLVPQVDITIINVFLKFVTGFVIDLVLFPLNAYRKFKGQPVISSIISGLSIVSQTNSNWIKIASGVIALIIVLGGNILFYRLNIPFKFGKRFTNYEKLLDYAVASRNPDMLQYFITEYKSRAEKDLSYYECIFSILSNSINESICKKAVELVGQNKTQLTTLHAFIGEYYYNQSDFEHAKVYLKYFYDNKIFDNQYWEYIESIAKLDKTLDKKTTIAKLDKQFTDIVKSDNYILLYKIALFYMDLRHFDKSIKILAKLKKAKPAILDYVDILWYLGESQFLNKAYKDGLANMLEASKLNPTQYKTIYDSYKSYYNTQVKK